MTGNNTQHFLSGRRTTIKMPVYDVASLHICAFQVRREMLVGIFGGVLLFHTHSGMAMFISVQPCPPAVGSLSFAHMDEMGSWNPRGSFNSFMGVSTAN